jgi:hypothetical protein
MSDAEFEAPGKSIKKQILRLKNPQNIIDYLSDVIYDRWYNNLINPQASPWASANELTRYAVSFARSGIVDDSSLISALAEASGLDYNTFKRLWDRLPRDRKVSLLNTVAYETALGGFAKFTESLANTLKNRDEKARKQVAKAVSKYLKEKTSYSNLIDTIASALWPRGVNRNDSRYIDFLHGAELARYLSSLDVERHLKDMVKGLKKHKWFW